MDGNVGRSRVSNRVAQRVALHHRILPTIAALLALLVSGLPAVPAAAAPNDGYRLTRAYVGDPMHIPILMYRHRHTILRADVSWDRNVAAFDFYPREGLRLIIVGPNVANWWNSDPWEAPLDVYRQDLETGEWSLVDFEGNPLGVDWRTMSEPTVTWNLATDPDPTILERAPHSEWVVSLFLELKLGGLNSTTRKGLSERIPCTALPNECRVNLENGRLFRGLVDMRFITDKPPTRKARKEGVDAAPGDLQGAQKLWEQAGMPTGWDAAARMGNRAFVTPGSQAPQGAASGALAPGSDLGGIDFSTLELRYLKDGSGGQLQYAFSASPDDTGKSNLADGQLAAVQSSDAFFVWLSMPESTFWVNLNPNEPDRIIDATLGTTDVGRILLEADLRMKRVVGRLIHPDTELGKRFWGEITGETICLDIRQWIVPGPATVYEQDGGLYIVDAPLEVKAETEYFKARGLPTSCESPDAAAASRFTGLVLPKLQDEINHGPEFVELRRVYLSRVAAAWYRDRHSRGGTLSSMIDSGDVSAWPALRDWSPRKVFDQYVEAFEKKEFDITRQETRGGVTYEVFYTYGGVDFEKVALHRVSRATLEQTHPGLTGTIQQSIRQRATDQRGMVWLGAVSEPVPLPDFHRPGSPTSSPWFYILIALPVVAWIAVGAWLVWLRQRRPRVVSV